MYIFVCMCMHYVCIYFNIFEYPMTKKKLLNIMVDNSKVYGLTNISIEVSSILTYNFRLFIDPILKCVSC
jgi:hypothetical protein